MRESRYWSIREMGEPAIISKPRGLLSRGISSEAEAVYLLVEIRKLLEQRNAKEQYKYLTFHCDWAVHSRLRGATAQMILKIFDDASPHLKAGSGLDGLPDLLRIELDRLSKMKYFEQQLTGFLRDNGLPAIDAARPDGWTHFEHLYARVVEDCPLIIQAQNASATIANVTLQVQLASRVEHGEVLFKVNWIIEDKNGKTGEVFAINSFSADPAGSASATASPEENSSSSSVS
jgi:hypothetical protein